jgi:biopolymer transport protein ExbD
VKRKHIRKRGRRYVMPEVSLTPLIDTALTLLVIFMVTVPMMQHGIKVDLPQGATKEAPKQQELVVVVTKDGKLFFNSFPVTKETLIEKVKKEMGDSGDIVHVRADKGASYGSVIDIVDTLKGTVPAVALSTRAMT